MRRTKMSDKESDRPRRIRDDVRPHLHRTGSQDVCVEKRRHASIEAECETARHCIARLRRRFRFETEDLLSVVYEKIAKQSSFPFIPRSEAFIFTLCYNTLKDMFRARSREYRALKALSEEPPEPDTADDMLAIRVLCYRHGMTIDEMVLIARKQPEWYRNEIQGASND